MLGDAYTLEYTELFNDELAEAVRYIATELRNPEAAARLHLQYTFCSHPVPLTLSQ